MAKSALEMLGINQEILDQVEPEEVYEGSTRPAGLYEVAVDKAYIRKTDSGANMLEIDFKMDDGSDFHYATCVLSGDEKGNKSTYTTKQGKERALPGVESLTKFLAAIDSLKAPAVKGDVEHRGTKIEALCFSGLQGKKLQIGINQEENFYQGDILVKNDVKYWLDENGKNSAGEDLTEKVEESLEKHPIKKYRPKGGAAPSAGTTAPAAGTAVNAGDGW
jgi:hypothetical protein